MSSNFVVDSELDSDDAQSVKDEDSQEFSHTDIDADESESESQESQPQSAEQSEESEQSPCSDSDEWNNDDDLPPTQRVMTRSHTRSIRVHVELHSEEHERMSFNVRRADELQGLLEEFCDCYDLEPADVSFVFDEEQVLPQSTAAELGIEQDDTIEAVVVERPVLRPRPQETCQESSGESGEEEDDREPVDEEMQQIANDAAEELLSTLLQDDYDLDTGMDLLVNIGNMEIDAHSLLSLFAPDSSTAATDALRLVAPTLLAFLVEYPEKRACVFCVDVVVALLESGADAQVVIEDTVEELDGSEEEEEDELDEPKTPEQHCTGQFLVYAILKLISEDCYIDWEDDEEMGDKPSFGGLQALRLVKTLLEFGADPTEQFNLCIGLVTGAQIKPLVRAFLNDGQVNPFEKGQDGECAADQDTMGIFVKEFNDYRRQNPNPRCYPHVPGVNRIPFSSLTPVRDNYIGRGGFGEVSEVSLGQHRVAVKTVLAEKIQKYGGFDKVREEMKLWAELSKKTDGVVRLIGYTWLNQPTLLKQTFAPVMELMNCGSLEAVKKDLQLGKPVLRDLLVQVCKTVAEMHAASFAHGDIKPANILVHSTTIDDDGTSVVSHVAKLSDFGGLRRIGDPVPGQCTLSYRPEKGLIMNLDRCETHRFNDVHALAKTIDDILEIREADCVLAQMTQALTNGVTPENLVDMLLQKLQDLSFSVAGTKRKADAETAGGPRPKQRVRVSDTPTHTQPNPDQGIASPKPPSSFVQVLIPQDQQQAHGTPDAPHQHGTVPSASVSLGELAVQVREFADKVAARVATSNVEGASDQALLSQTRQDLLNLAQGISSGCWSAAGANTDA